MFALFLSALAAPPLATVANTADLPMKIAPSGKAKVRQLARGENAFIAELFLDAGAMVPPHRDATEEYILVREGSGTLTIDGVEHAMKPGTIVFMPANAEVSATIDPTGPFKGIQVFAGPDPAAKYESWKAAD